MRSNNSTFTDEIKTLAMKEREKERHNSVLRRTTDKEVKTKITLPNGTTFITGIMTPLQLKIFTFILKELQPLIEVQLPSLKDFAAKKIDLNSYNKGQIDLFGNIKIGNFTIEDNKFRIGLPKKIFISNSHYDRFIQEVKDLAFTEVRFKRRNPKNNKIEQITTTLYSIIETDPEGKLKLRTVEIYLDNWVVERLCTISVANPKEIKWDVDFYSQTSFNTILKTKKKYTGFLYLYLSAWRSKGMWKIPTSELKLLLGIPEESYQRARDLKRNVLDPATKELKKIKADFWFEYTITKETITFNIIDESLLRQRQLESSQIKSLLETVKVRKETIEELRPLYEEPKNFKKLKEIILDCINQYYERIDGKEPIGNISAYTIAAIKNWSENKKRK